MTYGFARWREALALDRRDAPELYTDPAAVQAGAHADAIRFMLTELRLAGVFCIEGVPTIGFLDGEGDSADRINELHRILWNQGLMSLLLVMRDDQLTAYSLVQRPFHENREVGADPRLVATLSLVSDALKLRELIDSAESGRFWFENDEYFNPEDRVDNVLLSNLLEAFRSIRDELGGDAAQAVLMQTMFIAYLEDRQIIKTEVFREASGALCGTLAEILDADTPAHFEALFAWLKTAFNGNLFNAPCAFETGTAAAPKLSGRHLRILGTFRHGREDMSSGQLRLWGYDFRYMSIGLISAVYDRFLKEEAERRNADGAFYTPMFLADVVINQVWDTLSDEQRSKGLFCDPSCGSGIFLVRLFQRLVAHHCRVRNKSYATWHELKAIARRLHGADINSSAVRVAAFSLYIALLEQSNPPDLPSLIKAGKLLPSLYGDTLQPALDFFTTSDAPTYDAVIGNPPWKGRSGQITTAQRWSAANSYPDPAKEIAWGFVWKALKVVKTDGLVAFLLPAMGVLHNTSRESQNSRRRLLKEARVKRIINLSDLCFQLFDGAQRPTAFVLYERSNNLSGPYSFEYWVPKADLNLRLKRMMSLSRADRMRFRSDRASDDPTLFKRRLWTRAPEEKLIQYLRTIPKLSAFVRESKEVGKATIDRERDWVIGQGFQPADEERLAERPDDFYLSPPVAAYPYFAAKGLRAIAIPKVQSRAWPTPWVRRPGFTLGFEGPHILIAQGVERATGRVRAAYSDQDIVFQHSIQALIFPKSESNKAKILTAVLNSSLAAWLYFHDTANLGTDRAKVHQGELLKLPFDVAEKMPDPARAEAAARKIVQLVDRELASANELLTLQGTQVLAELDHLVAQYYGLDAHDVALIEDTFNFIIPAMQPRRSAGRQKIWDASRIDHRRAYADLLCHALQPSFREPVHASLAARSSDVALLKLTIGAEPASYWEEDDREVTTILTAIAADLPVRLPGNVQLTPDLRFVVGSDMYLVKPMQLRHWLRSTALADAEAISAEFAAVAARQSLEGDHAGR